MTTSTTRCVGSAFLGIFVVSLSLAAVGCVSRADISGTYASEVGRWNVYLIERDGDAFRVTVRAAEGEIVTSYGIARSRTNRYRLWTDSARRDCLEVTPVPDGLAGVYHDSRRQAVFSTVLVRL